MSEHVDETDGAGTGRTTALQTTATELATIRAQLASAEKNAGIWRGLGTVAAGLAITLGGAALNTAQTAAVDHVRVDRLERTELAREDRIERLVETQSRQAEALARQASTLEQMDRVLSEVRTDVRELRAEARREHAGDRR